MLPGSDGGGVFDVLLDALVMREASYDDARLETLFTALVAHAPLHAPSPAARSLLLAGLRHKDFRRVAMCCRMWGHLPADFDADWSLIWPLLQHPEPLVRHAALYATRVARKVPVCSWMERLLDESEWVQGEAHCVFAAALRADAIDDAPALLNALYGNVSAHAERAVIRLTHALVDVAPVARLHGLRVLLERHVVAQPLTWEANATLAIVQHAGWSDPGQLREWVLATLDAGPRCVPTAVALLAACPHTLQEALVDDIAAQHGVACLLPLARARGPEWAHYPLEVLEGADAQSPKAVCAAASLLGEWRVPVSVDVVGALLRCAEPRVVRAALGLMCHDWNALSGVCDELLAQCHNDHLLCPLVWNAVVAHNIHGAVDFCVASYLDGAALLPPEVRAQAWERFVPWLGPSHRHTASMALSGLDLSVVPLDCVAPALLLLARPDWALVEVEAQQAAVAACLQRCHDDAAPALAALEWIRARPTQHPDTPELLVAHAVEHPARAVRAAAWALLAECEAPLCASWPQLRKECARAAEQCQLQSVASVYGTEVERLAQLLDDAMLDTGEPDCCE